MTEYDGVVTWVCVSGSISLELKLLTVISEPATNSFAECRLPVVPRAHIRPTHKQTQDLRPRVAEASRRRVQDVASIQGLSLRHRAGCGAGIGRGNMTLRAPRGELVEEHVAT